VLLEKAKSTASFSSVTNLAKNVGSLTGLANAKDLEVRREGQ